jgi:ankyrin repeat protein
LSLEIVKFLIQRKVEINPRNQNGETPLEVASACDHDEIVVWLEDRGATMRPETTQDANTRKQIDSKTEKAARAFEAEEMLGLIRHSTKKKWSIIAMMPG